MMVNILVDIELLKLLVCKYGFMAVPFWNLPPIRKDRNQVDSL